MNAARGIFALPTGEPISPVHQLKLPITQHFPIVVEIHKALIARDCRVPQITVDLTQPFAHARAVVRPREIRQVSAPFLKIWIQPFGGRIIVEERYLVLFTSGRVWSVSYTGSDYERDEIKFQNYSVLDEPQPFQKIVSLENEDEKQWFNERLQRLLTYIQSFPECTEHPYCESLACTEAEWAELTRAPYPQSPAFPSFYCVVQYDGTRFTERDELVVKQLKAFRTPFSELPTLWSKVALRGHEHGLCQTVFVEGVDGFSLQAKLSELRKHIQSCEPSLRNKEGSFQYLIYQFRPHYEGNIYVRVMDHVNDQYAIWDATMRAFPLGHARRQQIMALREQAPCISIRDWVYDVSRAFPPLEHFRIEVQRYVGFDEIERIYHIAPYQTDVAVYERLPENSPQ